MTKTLSKVIKRGNSQAISLNKIALTKAGLKIGDELEYQVQNGQIIFTKKEKTLKDEIQEFYKNGGKYEEAEIDFGESVGKEIW